MNYPEKQRLALLALCVFGLFALLSLGSFAEEVPANAVYCFTGAEFGGSDAQQEGVYLSSAPAEELGVLMLGGRVLRSGDVVPASAFGELRFVPHCDETVCAEIGYRSISGGVLGGEDVCRMHIRSSKNAAPTAADLSLETYRNIPITAQLRAVDPENDPIRYQIVDAPKRGEVSLSEDGRAVYTPNKNKLGDDSFTYMATDTAGNVSEKATVRVKIAKPGDAQTFADVDPDAQFPAMWMREQGLYGGSMLTGELCFCPEQTVSRGEFLAMAMKLAGLPAEDSGLQSGFADAEEAPAWQQPWLAGAVRRGIARGSAGEQGLRFRPNDPITAAEAAVLLERCFLPESAQSVASVEEDPVEPVWAAQAAASLRNAGVTLPEAPDAPLDRAQTAALLYAVSKLG